MTPPLRAQALFQDLEAVLDLRWLGGLAGAERILWSPLEASAPLYGRMNWIQPARVQILGPDESVFLNRLTPAARAHIRRMDELRATLVREGASLGANCTIVCGVTIGRYALVGAGSVVTRDVPDHALVYGNPARQRGWVCQCGEKLDAELRCPACGCAHAPATGGIAPVSA